MASLSPNGLRLTEKLLSLPRNWITAASLASAVGVSRRTVLRELPELEKWMTAQGFHFLRSPGLGLMLDEGEEGRERLHCLLGGDPKPVVLSREERRQKLLLTLLGSQKPLKIYSLAKDLDISENTLSSDLDAIEQTLSPWEVSLCRRPGVGIWLDGTPESLRRALGTLVKTKLYARELHGLFQGSKNTSSFPETLFAPEDAKQVWDLLVDFDSSQKLHFSEAHLTSLAVHILLTLRQLRLGISDSAAPNTHLDLSRADRLAQHITKAFHVNLSLAEKQNLALYLDAYGQGDGTDSREMEVRYLATYLIRGVCNALGVDLSAYTTLSDDLCSHLRPMLLRLQTHMHNENPPLADLQEQYPDLWQAARLVCDNARKAGLCPQIPDEEAGYLAMHIGAVLEQEHLIQSRLDIAVVCPYGLASSKFLAAQIKREFPSIHIEFCGSLQGLDPEQLRKKRVDLIVSTVPIKIPFPHIQVNTILQENDRNLIRSAMEAERQRSRPEKAAKPDRRAALRYTAEMSSEILRLLNHVTLQRIEDPKSKDAFIQQASRLFCQDPQQIPSIAAQLWHRENLSSTYIKPLRALLLHCRTEAVRHCRLGYLSAKPPVMLEGQWVEGALVLLAPKDGQIPLEIMQAVSALLIEQPALMEAFRSEDMAQAVELLEAGLSQRFRDALSMQL